jgi:hypothetical protein
VNVVLTVTDADGITATSPTLPLTIAAATTTTTTSTSTSTSTPTIAQLKASLRSQLTPTGKTAKIAALLRRGYAIAFTALGRGAVVIDWYYLPKGAHLASRKPVLVAAGTRTFKTAGTLTITIKLTTTGRRLLKHARRIRLTAKGTFTAVAAPAISATKTFTLTR